MSAMKRRATKKDRALQGTSSIAHAAQQLNLSQRDVRKLLAQQKLDFVQIQGAIRIPNTSLEPFLKRMP